MMRSLKKYLWDIAGTKPSFPLATGLLMHLDHGLRAKDLPPDQIAKYTLLASKLFGVPLAILPMRLELFPQDLRYRLLVEETYRFDTKHILDRTCVDFMEQTTNHPFRPRYQAMLDSIACITKTSHLPTMAAIHGTWTLATEMANEELINAISDFSFGDTAEGNAGIRMLEQVLFLAENTVKRAINAFHKAGIDAIMFCDPALSKVCFSPNMMKARPQAFQKYYLEPMRRIKNLTESLDIGFCLHTCGELCREIVERLGTLEPLVFSAGCATPQVKCGKEMMLWEIASLVPETVIVAGGAPTKRLGQISTEEFLDRLGPLRKNMASTGRRYIEMSECDLPVSDDPVMMGKIWAAVEEWWPTYC